MDIFLWFVCNELREGLLSHLVLVQGKIICLKESPPKSLPKNKALQKKRLNENL